MDLSGLNINLLYLVCAVLIFSSVLGSMLSARLGMPLLLIFLGVGMLAGEEGILQIKFENFFLSNLLGQLALAVILLDGGLRTSIKSFRMVFKPALALATWGVLATVALLGVFAKWILGVEWAFAFLMAGIVGSTDAGAVFSLLRNGGVRLNERVQATLEIESGANDPMAILLVTGFIALNLNPQEVAVQDFVLMLIQQLGIGGLFGWVVGYGLAQWLPHLRLAEGMYALLILSGGLIVFALANLIGGSGFLAIYLAGVMIGNQKARATEHVLQVMDGLSWMCQVILFVVLGLLVTPSDLLKSLPQALALSFVLIVIVRPLAIFSTLTWFGYRWREMLFISWVGLRGAVPVTLAIMPVMANVPNGALLFNLTFTLVIISLLVQGMTLPKMSQIFKVRVPTIHEPNDRREIWVGNRESLNVFEYIVRKGSFAVGRDPEEIARRLNPDNLRVLAFVRDGKVQSLEGSTSLRRDDSVWYTQIGDDEIDELAKIFNDTAVEKQEQSEFFGEWIVAPSVLISELALLDDVPLSASDRELSVQAYLKNHLTVAPVMGDEIPIGEDWLFVVRETDDLGEIISVGVKLVHH